MNILRREETMQMVTVLMPPPLLLMLILMQNIEVMISQCEMQLPMSIAIAIAHQQMHSIKSTLNMTKVHFHVVRCYSSVHCVSKVSSCIWITDDKNNLLNPWRTFYASLSFFVVVWLTLDIWLKMWIATRISAHPDKTCTTLFFAASIKPHIVHTNLIVVNNFRKFSAAMKKLPPFL